MCRRQSHNGDRHPQIRKKCRKLCGYGDGTAANKGGRERCRVGTSQWYDDRDTGTEEQGYPIRRTGRVRGRQMWVKSVLWQVHDEPGAQRPHSLQVAE